VSGSQKPVVNINVNGAVVMKLWLGWLRNTVQSELVICFGATRWIRVLSFDILLKVTFVFHNCFLN